MFAKQGLQGASMREISQLADVNLAAINYHFQSKEQLYMAVITEFFERMFAAMGSLEGTAPGEEENYIRNFVDHHFRMLFHNDKELELIIARELAVQSERRAQLCQQFFAPGLCTLVAVIRSGIDSGRFRAVDPGLASLSLVGMCVFYANKREMIGNLIGTDTYSDDFRDRAARHTAELFLQGIRSK